MRSVELLVHSPSWASARATERLSKQEEAFLHSKGQNLETPEKGGPRAGARWAGKVCGCPKPANSEVVMYMPMIPEAKLAFSTATVPTSSDCCLSAYTKCVSNVQAVFAMLACARLGAPHSVVFGGFAGCFGGDEI